MFLRTSVIVLSTTLAVTTACTNKKVNNPLAKIDSKQPDKVLFDRGMDEMKHNHFEVARLDMQALINTYPESEYIARAKLALADSWYAEGGTTALAQAEQEYKDFITFFPNMPEAAEAQLKIANIHFSEMEKPDRDFTHAVRAEQEYRNVILQYPDNQKMVAEAKKKLMQVQEVIAEREFRVGQFYYLRGSYPAAQARLESLLERYPLYSRADDALYLIGQSYEGEADNIRRANDLERKEMEKLHKFDRAKLEKDQADREKYISDRLVPRAAEAYSKLLTRYPVMDRADDAKARLIALHQPVPRPTRAELAQNKAEEDARREEGIISRAVGAFSRHPDVSEATTVGNPSLDTPEPVSASAVVQEMTKVAAGNKPADNTLRGAIVGTGEPPANEAAPRSDDPAKPAATNDANAPSDPNELKPTQAANATNQQPDDPNELKPNVASDQPTAAPPQINEIPSGTQGGGATAQASSSDASGQEPADDQMIASSKHKKKKGLHKIIPGK
ncbi:MAG TPA: outer membrane protein assembly factor BamD [Bryobacteraceae bacterium]|nr:outer membrane protein assembly factor BamD [Bryobacteraceae bacterium]